MNLCVHFSCKLQSEISGLYGNSMFKLLRICWTAFQRSRYCFIFPPTLYEGSNCSKSSLSFLIIFSGGLVVKNPPANAKDVRHLGLIAGSGRSHGGGHGAHSVFLPGESQGQKSLGSQRVGHNWSDLAHSSKYNGEGNGTPLQYSCLENPMDGGAWWAAVHGVAKSRTGLRDFTFTFHFPALEKEMETHSSVLAWRVPGMGEPGGLPSMGLHRVGHDWSDLAVAVAVSIK